MRKMIFCILSLLFFLHANAQITINEARGWLESAYVIWHPLSGADSYNVYYTGEEITDQKIDSQLIRSYDGYYRADIPGLAAGDYSFKVVPVIGGTENATDAATTSSLIVISQIREGFAFNNGSLPGAYKANGTLKEGAQILYINNNTAKTVTLNIITDSKGTTDTVTGIAKILEIKGKGYDRTPLCVRFIGKVLKENIDVIKDNMYLDLQGSKSLLEAEENNKGPLFNVTLEGVGDDATLYGFGLNLKRTAYVEIRNLGFMLWGGGSDGDAISMDTDNFYVWVHNNDLFYGEPGGDADQVKGDGSIDMKYNSTYITISFNHFWDSGKAMGCGGATGEDNQLYITFHHNWFDHSDSRMPRLTYTNAHVYNNFYDGVSTYGIGTSRYSSAFVENNYFRGSYRPMLIPGQGTDVWEGGMDFSGSSFTEQDGGMTKAYNNALNGGNAENNLSYFNQNTTPVSGQLDAYEVTDPVATVPGSVAAVRGGYTYNNFDTEAGMYEYTAELPEAARNTILNLAGRTNGGDFTFTFNNTVEDGNKSVITALNDSILNYNTYYGSYRKDTSRSDIEAPAENAQLKVYPNPVSQYLYLSSDVPVVEINIYSLTGILLINSKTDITAIDISNLPQGTYCVAVRTETGMSRKMVIKN
ncbi:MAG: T9SS type A sorting domain-containing protein [Bacteroidales bacterium]|nr:T9SS type A sorting domain-containing protein [Bacteroidales bacterium]